MLLETGRKEIEVVGTARPLGALHGRLSLLFISGAVGKCVPVESAD